MAQTAQPVPRSFDVVSQNNRDADGKALSVWFALAEDRPLAFFAGIWTIKTTVRKVKEGRGDRHPLRLPDDRAERRGRRRPSQGNAGHPDRARRVRGLAHGPMVGGKGSTTGLAGGGASGRGARRAQGWGRWPVEGGDKTGQWSGATVVL